MSRNTRRLGWGLALLASVFALGWVLWLKSLLPMTVFLIIFAGVPVLIALALIAVFASMLSARSESKRVNILLDIGRVSVAILAVVGLGVVAFHGALRTVTYAYICNPALAEDSCQSVEAQVTVDEGIYMISETDTSPACWTNSDGNPWGGGEPCRDKATGEPRIILPAPKGYEFRWER